MARGLPRKKPAPSATQGAKWSKELQLGQKRSDKIRKAAQSVRDELYNGKNKRETVPKGQAGRTEAAGFALRTRLGLGKPEHKDYYNDLISLTIYIASTKLPIGRLLSQQHDTLLEETCNFIKQSIPFFQDLKGTWAIRAILKQRAKNTSASLTKLKRKLGIVERRAETHSLSEGEEEDLEDEELEEEELASEGEDVESDEEPAAPKKSKLKVAAPPPAKSKVKLAAPPPAKPQAPTKAKKGWL
ncbi:RTC4 domain-containing protein [Mycena kentingensis (nom. inval.)]|nr:RTC4 domain-containing protein [Mycena kentingensis (nom. inval.)]